MSITPGYLYKVGLAGAPATSYQALINRQLKQALDRVAFLPFGRMIDQWRWRVFSGEIAPADYNRSWWSLRTQYQGVAAPAPRSEADFDPGAKYHIPANVPYTRYFLAHILQFQFQRALCRTAGDTGPLYSCSLFGSREAGRPLRAMLALGATRPWREALATLSGEQEMDATAILEYFTPLSRWLDEQNRGRQCGWQRSEPAGQL